MADPDARPRAELRELLRLAVPLILSSIGTTLMASVDVLIVGPCGKLALGAVALGSGYATLVTILAMLVLGPVDAMVARALGEGKPDRAGATLRAGILVALALAIPALLLMRVPEPALRLLVGSGPDAPALIAQAADYSRTLALGAPFLMVFTALRCFVEGHARPTPATVILLSANLLNAGGDWVLVYGHLGLPALGSTGSAWSTALVQVAMCLALLGYVLRDSVLRATAALRRLFRIEPAAIRQIVRLGIPIAFMEACRNAVPTILAGMLERFGTATLAGNQIALSLFFLGHMVPLGMCWALGIRIANHLGRDDRAAARRSLRTGYGVGLGFAGCVALVYLLFGRLIVGRYTNDPATLDAGTQLLHAFVPMQIASAAASIGIGGLFGLLDMRFMALANVTVLYLLAVPLAWLLAFHSHLGPWAVWLGPSSAQLLLAIVFAWRFRRLLDARPAPAAAAAAG